MLATESTNLQKDALAYTVAPCSLGFVLIAETGEKIRAILLGDDPLALAAELQRRFPDAALSAQDISSPEVVAKIISKIEHPEQVLDLPLDIRGTPFQLKVWQALQSIPAGTTVNYAAIAKRIGTPESVRAVAQAIGANLLAIAIPCHRVIRSNGDLSGYRWRTERKRVLLRREAAI